ncbi:DUF11 domain-containing protein [Candidatus Roizmanbacteria bacterium]|nr:DUF11 domain-containing protein [Candidatus Roizmanbacteria bacterium]
MKYLVCVFVTGLLYLLTTVSVNAQYGCPPYGAECPSASVIVVDKFIRDPRQKGDVYVDNLTVSDYRFSPNEDIIFKIVIKNTGTEAVENVSADDVLPQLTDLVTPTGDIRDFRDASRTFGTLEPGESKEWFLRVRVKAADAVPGGTVCGDPNAINRVTVHAKDMPDAQDTSSFCIQKTVLGAVAQPEAGTPLYLLASTFLGMIGVGLVGKKVYS